MASNSVCTACRQALRRQVRQLRQPQAPYQSRAAAAHLRTPRPFRDLSTSPFLSAVQTTEDSPTRTIAKELRKRASSVTETYVAYGVCENLIKECARQADYTIPQAHEKNIDIPKTKDGEDLGVGTGWWYESMSIYITSPQQVQGDLSLVPPTCQPLDVHTNDILSQRSA
ncbi:hypothetical protein N7G274_001173 [Stereocaulon virgatum]|uniref:Uncharacterized protein n=1 Tax=Stereocaulon virgatum TaxID=373712 RepID=A0ABR4ANN0_9LECA